MSRAAENSATVGKHPPTYLVLQKNVNSSSTAIVRSEPFSTSYPTDFAALVMLASLSEYPAPSEGRVNKKREQKLDQLQQRVRQEKNNQKLKLKPASYVAFSAQPVFKMSSTVLMKMLDFLVYNNTWQCIPLMLAPANFPNDLGRIDSLISHLTPRLQNSLFSENYEKSYEIVCLLDAALNADLAVVERILRNSKNPQAMLCVKENATITHLNIERTGTPLQMALYGHDEEMVAAIKRHMDPAEFQRQWEAVFGPDYNAFLERQEAEAKQLCSELESAFKAASATDVTNALKRVANTTSALQDALNRFKDNLERYVRENKVHNPYILQRLFEIYDTPTFDDWNKDCLISQQAIGVTQKISSPRWLQHLSQGIYDLAQNNEPARRSFALRDSQPQLDIRSLDRLGVDSCIHIFAAWGARFAASRVEVGGPLFKTYVEQKQQAFRTLCRDYESSHSRRNVA